MYNAKKAILEFKSKSYIDMINSRHFVEKVCCSQHAMVLTVINGISDAHLVLRKYTKKVQIKLDKDMAKHSELKVAQVFLTK